MTRPKHCGHTWRGSHCTALASHILTAGRNATITCALHKDAETNRLRRETSIEPAATPVVQPPDAAPLAPTLF